MNYGLESHRTAWKRLSLAVNGANLTSMVILFYSSSLYIDWTIDSASTFKRGSNAWKYRAYHKEQIGLTILSFSLMNYKEL